MGAALDALKRKTQNTDNSVSTQKSNSARNSSPSSSAPKSASEDDTSIFTNKDENDDNKSYFQRHETDEGLSGLSESEKYDRLNELMEKRNKAEAEAGKNKCHGLSDAEYKELRALLNEYGISTEQEYNYGHFQNVAVAMGESCENSVRFNAACKAAASMDCLEDMVLMRELQEALKELYPNDTDPGWKALAGNKRLLKEYGIAIVQTADRQYSVAKVDENGNILQNKDGKLVQYYTSDMLMPDGQAQMNEVHVAEMIDAMGFDCVSALDFSTEEYDMIMELGYSNTSASGFSFTNVGGVRDEVLGTYDKDTNTWSKAKAQDRTDWLNDTYYDKVAGKYTGKKDRWREFRNSKYKSSDNSTFASDNNKKFFNGPSGNGPDASFAGLSFASNAGNYVNENGQLIDPKTGKVIADAPTQEETSETKTKGTDKTQNTDENNVPTKKQQQKTFNKLVEKYFKKGYSFKKALSLANSALGTKYMEYKGENITKAQRKGESEK